MAKDLSISVLLDFYGDMLTEKQREVVDYYYNEDLSLAEIAEHCGITRQGVRDSIKRAESQLYECEEKLGLMARMGSIQDAASEILETAADLQKEASALPYCGKVLEKVQRIIDLATALNI